MSDAALRARRQNLTNVPRLRCVTESELIKRLTWQFYLDGSRPSQRALARLLGVSPSYICKLGKRLSKGLDVLASRQRVTLDDLAQARHVTARRRGKEPGLLASHSDAVPAMTADESIAATWRDVNDWKRKNLRYSRRRMGLFSVRVR